MEVKVKRTERSASAKKAGDAMNEERSGPAEMIGCSSKGPYSGGDVLS